VLRSGKEISFGVGRCLLGKGTGEGGEGWERL